jgi:hypothetical protein
MTKANDLASLLDANGDVVSSALDNVPASDLVNDTTPQLGGTLDTNTNDINFGDNDKAVFGAGSDLQIYHDGSDSYMTESATGSLYIGADSTIALTDAAVTQNKAQFITGGAVNLFHNNALKLATTATGVDVTGTVTADGLDIQGDGEISGGSRLTISDIADVNNDGIRLADNTTGRFNNLTQDTSGNFKIQHWTGSAWQNNLTLTTGGNVGIGTSSPSSYGTLAVAGTIATVPDNNGYALLAGRYSSSYPNATLNSIDGVPWVIQQNGTERFRINASGHITQTGYTAYGTSAIGYIGDAANLFSGSASDFAVRGTSNVTFGIGASEKMRIDSSGNVTIQPAGTQTRSFGETVAVKKDQSAPTRLSVRNDTNNSNSAAGVTVSASGNSWAIECGSYNKNNNALTFALDATAATPSEKMRLDSSGNLLVASTSESNMWRGLGQNGTHLGWNYCASQYGSNTNLYMSKPSGYTDASYIAFFAVGIGVGSISTNGSATSYNTSSDYRLKENVTADWDATTRLKQLNPVRFNFISDADTTVDGFLAHEVQDIVPEAITGTKDAMRDEEYEVTPAVLDEDGNEVTPAVMGTRSVPNYQGIDQSKLVPLLVKAIQELEARIAALETA